MKHYHFMGIGGIGVSGLAHVLLERGERVSGCDLTLNALSRKLEVRGVTLFAGHGAEHITPDVDVLVTSTAVKDDEPEVVAARNAGKRVVRRIQVLGELMREKRSIAVTGTHGKTSTSAMIAAVFTGAGLDPTCVVGGELREIGGNARFGRGEHFIAEVDESDPFFQHLESDYAVITNVEDDHVGMEGDVRNNYHASLEALHEGFRNFARAGKQVVFCADWPGLREMLDGLPTISYGTLPGCDYRAVNVRLEGGAATYSLCVRGETLGEVHLRVPGLHNVLNSLATCAVALENGVTFAALAKALEGFRGAGRRWEVLGELDGALVVDDYAHNPTKVSSAIAGAITTGRRVRVVFQPHRYLRTARDWERYADALVKAHEVLILDIYAAGETPIPGVHASLIEGRLRSLGHAAAIYIPNREDVLEHLLKTVQPNDVIVTMGAGDVTRLGPQLLERARNKAGVKR